VDPIAADEPIAELLELTRQLRGQLARHAALGAWAAPGGASARTESTDAAADANAPTASTHDTTDTAPAFAAIASEGSTAMPSAGSAPMPSTGSAAMSSAGSAAIAAAMESPGPAAMSSAGFGAMPSVAAARIDPSIARDEPAEDEPDDAGAAVRDGVRAVADAPIVLGRRTLTQIRAELGDCTRCKLHSTRRSIVFGVGSGDTPLMFVGEAPGEQEDRRGEPFVGPAGQLLDKMIEAMGWTRGSVYIANTTKCRPPGNRNPQPDELSQCMPFLHAQIAAIAPRIIVALGRPASNQLLGTDAPISALRGRFHDYARATSDGVSLKIMPTFHPAYLLRDPDKKRAAWSDLKLVMAELARLGIAAPAPAPRG